MRRTYARARGCDAARPLFLHRITPTGPPDGARTVLLTALAQTGVDALFRAAGLP
jgi:hypothetical protein